MKDSIQTNINGEMICLNERPQELVEAMNRAGNGTLCVCNGQAFDDYVVTGGKSASRYEVRLKTIRGKVLASCRCADFLNRSRVCKHVAEVLRNVLKGIPQMSAR